MVANNGSTMVVRSTDLRSARRQQLNVPRVRRVIGRRAFASAGPTVWNLLPDND